jgi:anthraniloyl-CoA monooxygenase
VGIATMAVGAISSHEDVNTIILSGRADLCALGRPHLYDPHWTLHAAAEQGFAGARWIVNYQSGSRRPNDGRIDAKSPPRSFEAATTRVAARWRPRDLALAQQ